MSMALLGKALLAMALLGVALLGMALGVALRSQTGAEETALNVAAGPEELLERARSLDVLAAPQVPPRRFGQEPPVEARLDKVGHRRTEHLQAPRARS